MRLMLPANLIQEANAGSGGLKRGPDAPLLTPEEALLWCVHPVNHWRLCCVEPALLAEHHVNDTVIAAPEAMLWSGGWWPKRCTGRPLSRGRQLPAPPVLLPPLMLLLLLTACRCSHSLPAV